MELPLSLVALSKALMYDERAHHTSRLVVLENVLLVGKYNWICFGEMLTCFQF